jgi:1-acyl-sn-glycerol-3-phosphate acyltransferase
MTFYIRVTLAALVLLLCLPGHLIARRRTGTSPWVRRFMWLAGRAMGLRVRIEGQPLTRDVLYACNHVSWFDILAIGGATGAAFVSKDDVARWPLVGWLAREGGTIFIRRSARSEVLGQAGALAAALATGRPAALCPEGTTGDGRTLLPFRASLFAGVPEGARVQPVAIDYGAAAPEIAWTGNEGTGRNARRVLSRRGPLEVTLRFLPPIIEAADRKATAARAERAIGEALSRSGTIAYSPRA